MSVTNYQRCAWPIVFVVLPRVCHLSIIVEVHALPSTFATNCGCDLCVDCEIKSVREACAYVLCELFVF